MRPRDMFVALLIGVCGAALRAQPAEQRRQVTPNPAAQQAAPAPPAQATNGMPADTFLMKAGKEFRYHNQFGPAFEAYDRLTRQYPQSPYLLDALFYMAHCKHKLGLKTEALQLYAEYLAAAGTTQHQFISTAHQARAGLCQELRDMDCLRSLIKDPDPTTRFIAAWSLARMGDKAGVPVLVDTINGSDPALADRARIALFLLRDPRGLEALKKSQPDFARGPVVRLTINGDSVWVNSGMGDLLIDAMTPAQRETLKRAGITPEQLSRLNESSSPVMAQVPATGEEIRIQVIVPRGRREP